MLRTITLGSCVSIQGLFVREMPDGKTVIRVADKEYTGTAVRS